MSHFEHAPRVIELAGRKLAVRQQGSGSLVLLETGAGGLGLGTGWNGVDAHVAGFATVITYDRVGVGLSAAADALDDWQRSGRRRAPPLPTITDRVEDLAALLDALDVHEPVILVGWSAGGLIAQHFAGLHPQSVAGLLLIAPTPVRLSPGLKPGLRKLVDLRLGVRLLHLAARIGLLGTSLGQAWLRHFIARKVGPRFDRARHLAVFAAALTEPRMHDAVLFEAARLREGLVQTADVLQRHGLPQRPLIVLSPQFRGRGPVAAQVRRILNAVNERNAASMRGGELRCLDEIGRQVAFEAAEASVKAASDLGMRCGRLRLAA